MDAGRVAAAHLEAIERRQHALGGGERVDQVGVSIAFGAQCAHPASEAEAVVADRPGGVLGADQGGVEPLEIGAAHAESARVEGALEVAQSATDRGDPLLDLAAEVLAPDQQPDSVLGAQPAVDVVQRRGRARERGNPGRAVRRGRRRRDRRGITQGGEGAP